MNNAKKTAWSEYLERIAGTSVKAEISRATGISDATVGRWLNGQTIRPDIETVVTIARQFKAEPLFALVTVGYLRPEDIESVFTPREYGLDQYSDLELAQEIVRRIENGSTEFDESGNEAVSGDDQTDEKIADALPFRRKREPQQPRTLVAHTEPGKREEQESDDPE